MDFIKMHGLGNDFVVLDCPSGAPENPESLARAVCDRHFGVGADGLVLILPEEGADARMRIFNPDGSEPEMCGNAVRCVAKYLCESGRAAGDRIRIATLSGVMVTRAQIQDGAVARVSVDMGAPVELGRVALPVAGERAEFLRVSMGNPHAVTFSLYPDDAVFFADGPRIERAPVFPEGTNVEFCELAGVDHIRVRVWERGAGPTLACGTGAAASFYAGVRAGLIGRCARVTLPGGDLKFELDPAGHAIMTGPATEVFRGRF